MDDWEKKYWEKKSQGQNPFSNTSPSAPQPLIIPASSGGEIDATQILAARIASNGPTMPGFGGMPTHSTSSQSCFLREGYDYYVQINAQGFGGSTPLVKQVGKLSNTNGKSFVVSTKLNAYIVDELQHAVDLSKLSEQPEKMKLLVTVKTAFETFLVEESAIVYPNQNTNKLILG